jgi:CRISPR-associated protein Csd2
MSEQGQQPTDRNDPHWLRIKDKPYCDPARRMDFVLVFDVKDGNPNGDPDAGNLPRMDPTTRRGIVTDVCIKRKIRDYFAIVLNRPIFIQSQDALNTLLYRAAAQTDEAKPHLARLDVSAANLKKNLKIPESGGDRKPTDEEIEVVQRWLDSVEAEGLEYLSEQAVLTYFGEVKKKADFKGLLSGETLPPDLPNKVVDVIAKSLEDEKKKAGGGKLSQRVREAGKHKMCELYDDIRFFGAVLTGGMNFGQIRGPMQLTFARSVEPILQQDAAITRCAITKESDRVRKETEFGRKPWLSYAAYRQHGYFNAPLARSRETGGTGVTRDDLARFWEAVAGMFPNSQSASKGEMATQDLIVFVHNSDRGNAPSHRLLDRVKPVLNGRARLGFGADGKQDTDDAITKNGVEIHRPLEDLWGDLQGDV